MGLGITIDQLFYGAYREAGLVQLEQTILSPDQTEEARQVFNKMVDAWQLDGETVSHVARLLFDLRVCAGDYTVGPGGDFDPGAGRVLFNGSTDGTTGTIPSNYPCRIERASMVLTTQPDGGAGPPEYPIFPMTIDEWQTWTLKGQINNWPRRYYYEPDYPLGIIHVLYIPANANQIALYIEETITPIQATGNAILDFRPGYQDMIESNLAVRIAARNPGSNISADVRELAKSSLSLIKMSNTRPLSRINDMNGVSRFRSSVFLGNRYGQANNLRTPVKLEHSADVIMALEAHPRRAKSFRSGFRESFQS